MRAMANDLSRVGRGNQNSVKKVTTAEKTRQALEYRKAGMSYRAIGERVGWKSKSYVYKKITEALEQLVREPAEQLRTLELERLDRMFLALWQKITSGDAKAISTGLSIMERRAKLLGLDAPAKWEGDLDVHDSDLADLTDEQLLAIASGGGCGNITPSLCQETPD